MRSKKSEKTAEIKSIEYFNHKVLHANESANLFKSLHQFEKALDCYNEKLDLITKSDGESSTEAADVHEEIAECHKIMGNYNAASGELRKALDIYAAKEEGDSYLSRKRDLYLTIGSCFYENTEFNEALECFRDAFKICKNDEEKCAIDKLVQSCQDHLGTASKMENLLISCSWDSTIKIWDLNAKFECIKCISNGGGDVNCMLLLRKHLLLSGDQNKKIKLWNLCTNECVQVLEGHDQEVSSLLLINQELFASASFDGKIILWKKETQLHKVDTSDRDLMKFEEFLLNQWEAKNLKWEITSGFSKAFEVNAEQGSLSCLCAIKWDKVASGGKDGKICFWILQANNLRFLRSIGAHQGDVKSLMIVDNNCLASAGEDCTIHLWDLNEFVCTMTLSEHQNSVNCLLRLKSGIFASGSSDESIRMWVTGDETSRNTSECVEHRVKSLAEISGEVIASGDAFGKINLWSFRDYSLLCTINAHDNAVSAIQVLPILFNNASRNEI